MSDLTALMRALDDLCIAIWFQYPQVRPEQPRTQDDLKEVLHVAFDNARAAGATEEQMDDCGDYAQVLVHRNRPPLALGMRTWTQFRESLS